ncbi:hypothetical protein [Cryptosporangium phraense]|uniref:YcxB family protein n=1 Tax=Cryptosporangium phraense TaxID=2593070 RepID=A0A545APY0_9ACTN|nr:hypothetical protein [Cryptosporangium phraense]TQS42785.1 hypothetical protein FL583_22235 [Cryptosporangium phraense]
MYLTTSFRPTVGLALRAFTAAHPVVLTIFVLFLPVTLPESIVIGDYTVALAGAAPLLLVVALSWWQVRRMSQQKTAIRIEMTDTDYRLTQADKSASITWTNFRSARRRAGCWVLRCSPLVATTFPTCALDPAQTATFIAFLRDRGLLPRNTTVPTP